MTIVQELKWLKQSTKDYMQKYMTIDSCIDSNWICYDEYLRSQNANLFNINPMAHVYDEIGSSWLLDSTFSDYDDDEYYNLMKHNWVSDADYRSGNGLW